MLMLACWLPQSISCARIFQLCLTASLNWWNRLHGNNASALLDEIEVLKSERDEADPAACPNCNGRLWVCENHPTQTNWEECCGVGMMCGVCRREEIIRGAAFHAEKRVAELEREAELFDEGHADQNRMVDRIVDLIGLPHDQELDTTAFEIWFSKINSSAEHSDRVIAGLNKQLTEQFELSTKYVAMSERYRMALENIIDAANSFCDESGDDVAAQVKLRARQALSQSPSQGDGS